MIGLDAGMRPHAAIRIQKDIDKPAERTTWCLCRLNPFEFRAGSNTDCQEAANYIDKLQTALNRYSADEVMLTHQSTIAAQAEQIEALTKAVVDRDLIISQYITALGYVAA